MVICKRRFIEKSDAGFIVDSMPKEIYFDNKESRKGRVNKVWFENFHKYLTELISSAHIVMATTDEDPDFILGYAIFKNKQLEFVYVKEAYRKQGIGLMLSEDVDYNTINEANVTKIGRKIIEQRNQPKEKPLTNQDITEVKMPAPGSTATFDKLIANGIPLISATFQSAILSGFNTAEFKISTGSANIMRKPKAMWLTPSCVVIEQNDHIILVPTSNVIQADVK